jgi:hypothetical protein
MEREGHCRIPHEHLENRYKLGSWVTNQRQHFKSNNLSYDRIIKLSGLEGWSWSVSDDAWEHGFKYLKDFIAENGHSRVPSRSVYSGFNLFNWVAVQRRSMQDMSVERRDRLDKIGFAWDATDDYWNYAYSMLHKYFLENGHSRVPSKEVFDGFKLGVWVSNQRHRGHRLSDLQIERLNELNFVWSPFDESFEHGFLKIKMFKAQHGHANPSSRDFFDGFKIGSWATTIRASKDKLSETRIKMLDDVGFLWSQRSTQWDEKYGLLCEYFKEFSNCQISQKTIYKGQALGAWLNNQKFRLKSVSGQDRLALERKKKLEALGIVFAKAGSV